MSDKLKILYIDDEPDNLTGFKANFRTEYRIFIAENTVQAIEHLEKHPDIRVIFCDQRMPGKTGVEFFEEIKNLPYHNLSDEKIAEMELLMEKGLALLS